MTHQGGRPYEPTSQWVQPPSQQDPYNQLHSPYSQQNEASPHHTPTHVAPQQQAQPDPGAGRLIAGRYRLLTKLGHGGMGTVWRAKDEMMDREVAVKEPRLPEHLPERERANAFERMRREARAAARLDHPAVVNVHDVAVEEGQPWIVMEFLQGRSLADALQEGTLDSREAARIGLEVLGALDAAHQAGILHRDVKPDNVMLGRHGRVILTDFGIAQIEGETNLTETGGFVGSPEFIAPERVLGRRPGPASDLWSLGVVLYAATEGISPFRRNNTPATLQSVLNGTPAAPASAKGPSAEVINGLLNKDPARRPNATQVRKLLEEAAKPPQPTQVVRVAGPGGGKGIGLSRKGWIAVGTGGLAVVVAGVLLVVNPFAGPLPDGWKTEQVEGLSATMVVPEGYKKSVPDADSPKDERWVQYADLSDAVRITLHLEKKSDDSFGNSVAESAAAEMYDDNATYKESGSSDLGMDSEPAPKSYPKETTYKDKKAAENTITFSSTDSENQLPREAKIFYYRTTSGDMYKLVITYPGKGDFTDRGREVAKTAIANLGLDKL
ncbi:serine/threonine-protein kinase [Streptomyces sp. 3N207]|uniref:serine/threonine-protein kinase n=1 Tax=Streptomyces sp. 3N207 TaxID=3457417 RepID=UPI003FD0C6E5